MPVALATFPFAVDGKTYVISVSSGSVSPPPPPAPPEAPAVRTFIGANIDGISSSSPAPILAADVMKFARPFGTWNTPQDQAAPKDSQGWPTTSSSGVVVFVDRPFAAGTYAIRYPGNAVAKLLNSGSSAMSASYDAGTNMTTGAITVTGNALWLRFTGGAVKDVKIIAPGCLVSDTWNPIAMNCLTLFDGLRFMDWGRTNNSPLVSWNSRTQPDAATWNVQAGAPYEVMIDLHNALAAQRGKPIGGWYCVPPMADDYFCQRFGALLKSNVAGGLPIYVQYGNELWNFGAAFAQSYNYNLNQAAAEVAAGDNQLNDGGLDQNRFQWGWKREAKRTIRIKNLFPPDNRFRFVVESQHNYGTTEPARQARLQLEYVAKYWGPPANYFYAIASAPYSGAPAADKSNASLTATQYADDVYAAAGQSWNKGSLDRLALAQQYGVRYVAYEGNTAGDYQYANMQALLDAQSLQRMGDADAAYLNAWLSGGGNEFFWFVPWSNRGPVYVWGASDGPADLTAPRLAAIAGVNAGLP